MPNLNHPSAATFNMTSVQLNWRWMETHLGLSGLDGQAFEDRIKSIVWCAPLVRPEWALPSDRLAGGFNDSQLYLFSPILSALGCPDPAKIKAIFKTALHQIESLGVNKENGQKSYPNFWFGVEGSHKNRTHVLGELMDVDTRDSPWVERHNGAMFAITRLFSCSYGDSELLPLWNAIQNATSDRQTNFCAPASLFSLFLNQNAGIHPTDWAQTLVAGGGSRESFFLMPKTSGKSKDIKATLDRVKELRKNAINNGFLSMISSDGQAHSAMQYLRHTPLSVHDDGTCSLPAPSFHAIERISKWMPALITCPFTSEGKSWPMQDFRVSSADQAVFKKNIAASWLSLCWHASYAVSYDRSNTKWDKIELEPINPQKINAALDLADHVFDAALNSALESAEKGGWEYPLINGGRNSAKIQAALEDDSSPWHIEIVLHWMKRRMEKDENFHRNPAHIRDLATLCRSSFITSRQLDKFLSLPSVQSMRPLMAIVGLTEMLRWNLSYASFEKDEGKKSSSPYEGEYSKQSLKARRMVWEEKRKVWEKMIDFGMDKEMFPTFRLWWDAAMKCAAETRQAKLHDEPDTASDPCMENLSDWVRLLEGVYPYAAIQNLSVVLGCKNKSKTNVEALTYEALTYALCEQWLHHVAPNNFAQNLGSNQGSLSESEKKSALQISIIACLHREEALKSAPTVSAKAHVPRRT